MHIRPYRLRTFLHKVFKLSKRRRATEQWRCMRVTPDFGFACPVFRIAQLMVPRHQKVLYEEARI